MSNLDQYLKIIGLESYQSLLVENGYDDPDLINELTEDELVSIGVKKGHAKRAFLKVKELSNGGTISGSSSASTSTTTTSTTSSQPAPPTTAPPKKITMGKKGGADEEDDDSDDERSDKGAEIIQIASSGPKLQSRVVCEGFLQKKGNEGFFGSKVWAKRYFKLFEEGRLAYYKNQVDVSPINIVELRGALACEELEGKQYAFKISMKTSARVYYLLAPNAEAKTKWIASTKPLIVPPVVPKKIDPNALRPYVQHTQEPPQAASTRFDASNTWDVIEKPTFEGDIRLHLHSAGPLFVEETRKLTVEPNKPVWIYDLPKDVDDHTVHFQSLSEPSAFIVEQTYHNDPITPEKMLEKLIGKTIEVSIPRDKAYDLPHKFKGELQYVATQGKYALVNSETNQVHFLDNQESITYDLLDNSIPDGVFRKSSLEWTIASTEKDHLYKLSYNSKNLFNWYASYSIILNPRETEMELRGYYTIENKSGKTFQNANLVLIREPGSPVAVVEEKKEESPLPVPVPKLGGLFKLGKLPIPGLSLGGSKSEPVPEARVYKYVYENKTTLRDQETKQLSFISTRLPVKSVDYITFATPKYTKYASIGKDHGANVSKGVVDSSLVFTWTKPFPLPAGQCKLQRQSKDGFGSDIINTFNMSHYNPSDIIIVPLQSLGSVSASRKQTGFNFDIDNLYLVETFEIRVMNGREETVRVIVEESLYRWENFEITYTNEPHTPHPTHPRKVQWHLTIPPLDGITINYSVFYSGLALPDSAFPKKEPVAGKK